MKKIFRRASWLAMALTFSCAIVSCNSKGKISDHPQESSVQDSVVIESRMAIYEAMEKWGNCRTIALTENHGNLALKGNNTYVQSECPDELIKSLENLKAENSDVLIKDVVITEKGNWLILSEKNTITSKGTPADLDKKLLYHQQNGDEIFSVSFNDLGDWVISADHSFSCSDDEMLEEIKKDTQEYGRLWTTTYTDEGMIATYENGCSIYGDVPEDLEKTLEEVDLDTYIVKMNVDSSWFIADKEGIYNCDIATHYYNQ